MPGIDAPSSSCQTENQDSMGFMRIFVIEQLLHNSAPCTIYFIPLPPNIVSAKKGRRLINPPPRHPLF